jgi:hypothetical protein
VSVTLQLGYDLVLTCEVMLALGYMPLRQLRMRL